MSEWVVVGSSVGAVEGKIDGDIDCKSDGDMDGWVVGAAEGLVEVKKEGESVIRGTLGLLLGCFDTEGTWVRTDCLFFFTTLHLNPKYS